MQFVFFNLAGRPLFVREDAERAEWTHEEMSFYALFPYDSEKVIEHGMRVGFMDCRGAFQVFEVRKAKSYEPDHYQEITAEHIVISELTDDFCQAAEITNQSVETALAGLLTGTLWSVGNVAAGIPVSSADLSMGEVWPNIRTIEANWNVYITPRVTFSASGITGRYLDITPAQGTFRGVRLSLEKNADEMGVTWDDSKVKTALYGFGKAQTSNNPSTATQAAPPLTFADVVWAATADHPAKPQGQTYLEDPDATAEYGRGGRPRFGYYQNGDINDAELLLQKTWETLKTVRIPDVQIDSTVKDLYRMGYADQPLCLHDTAIVEIRPTGVSLAREIIRMTEDLLNPTMTRLTIGAYIPNIVYITRETASRATGGGGGSGRSQTKAEAKFAEYQTHITANEYTIQLNAQHLSETDGVLQDAGIAIESQDGVLIYHLDNTKGVGAELHTQSNKIGLVVGERSGGGNYIKAAEIVAAYNNDQTTQVRLRADYINIDGSTRIGGILGISDGDVIVVGGGVYSEQGFRTNDTSQFEGELTLLYDGLTLANGATIKFDGGQTLSASFNPVNDVILTPPTAGSNDYTLSYKDLGGDSHTVGTFSRAVSSFTGTWTGGALDVLASPQNQHYYDWIKGGTASWNGKIATVQILHSTTPGNEQSFQPTGQTVTVDASSIADGYTEIDLNGNSGSGPENSKPSTGLNKGTQYITGYIWGKAAADGKWYNIRSFSISTGATYSAQGLYYEDTDPTTGNKIYKSLPSGRLYYK